MLQQSLETVERDRVEFHLFSSASNFSSSSSNCWTIAGETEWAGHRLFSSPICCSRSLTLS